MEKYFDKERAAALLRSGFNWDDTVILMDMSSEDLINLIITEFGDMEKWEEYKSTQSPWDKKLIKICREGIQVRADKKQKLTDDAILAQQIIDDDIALKEKEAKNKAEDADAINKLPDAVGETIRHIGNKKFLNFLVKFNEVLQGTIDDTKVETKLEYVLNKKKVKIHLKN